MAKPWPCPGNGHGSNGLHQNGNGNGNGLAMAMAPWPGIGPAMDMLQWAPWPGNSLAMAMAMAPAKIVYVIVGNLSNHFCGDMFKSFDSELRGINWINFGLITLRYYY